MITGPVIESRSPYFNHFSTWVGTSSSSQAGSTQRRPPRTTSLHLNSMAKVRPWLKSRARLIHERLRRRLPRTQIEEDPSPVISDLHIQPPSRGCPLLDLPPEIRLKIFEYIYPGTYYCHLLIEERPKISRVGPICRQTTTICIPEGLQTGREPTCKGYHLLAVTEPISRVHMTCRLLNREAGTLFYDRTVFRVAVDGRRNMHLCPGYSFSHRDMCCNGCKLSLLASCRQPRSPNMTNRTQSTRCNRYLGSVGEWATWRVIQRLQIYLPFGRRRLSLSAPIDHEYVVRDHMARILHQLQQDQHFMRQTVSMKSCNMHIALGSQRGHEGARQVLLRTRPRFSRMLSTPQELQDTGEQRDAAQLVCFNITSCVDLLLDELDKTPGDWRNAICTTFG
jgi:hypothetical protein